MPSISVEIGPSRNKRDNSVVHPNLGNRTSLNSDLRTIGKKLLRHPDSVETFTALVRGLVATISNDPSSKRRLACKAQLKALESQLRDQQRPVYENERFASLMHPVFRALERRCRTNRRLVVHSLALMALASDAVREGAFIDVHQAKSFRANHPLVA